MSLCRTGSERLVGREVEDGDGELGEQSGEPVAGESGWERDAVEETRNVRMRGLTPFDPSW